MWELEKASYDPVSQVRTLCQSLFCLCPALHPHSWQNKEREALNTTEKENPSLSLDGSAIVAV